MNTSRDDAHRLRWWHLLLALAGLSLLVGLAWPWAASAYNVERAGRGLALGTVDPRVERQLDQALRWDPRNAQAYRLRAQLYQRQGQASAAAGALGNYVALRPADPVGLWALAVACEELPTQELAEVSGQPCGSDDDSRQVVLAWLWQAAGYTAVSLAEAGDDLRRDGKLKEAQQFYQRALMLSPEEPAAWYGLGAIREAAGQREAALEAYEQAAAAGADISMTARAHHRRGQILADARQWDAAAAALAQAVALMPGQGAYHLDYGWYLYMGGAPIDTAVGELEVAASLMPNNPSPHLRLARIAFAQQEYEAMLAHAEASVAVQPGQAWGWLYQGQALDSLRRLAEAEAALRQALELAPENAAAHDALGHVLAQTGDLAAAIAACERAVALAPENVDYHLRLANNYRANGQADRAREAYRRVLALDPGNSVATQALEGMTP